MKKTLLFAASCLVLFTACKKDATKEIEDPKSEERFPVSFDVSQFTQVSTPMSVKQTSGYKDLVAPAQIEAGDGTPTPLPGISELVYAVFDTNGNLVSRLYQQFGSPTTTYRMVNGLRKISVVGTPSSFGGVKDTLAAGTYTVIVAGTPMYPLMFNNPQEGINGVPYTNATLVSASLNLQSYMPFQETYLYKGTLSVSGAMALQTLKMNRIVGAIDLYMEDTAPAAAKTFSCDITPADHTNYKVSDGTTSGPVASPWGTAGVEYDVSNIARLKGLITSTYRLNLSNATMTVKFYDANKSVILTKVIPNISVKANQLTKVTGKMFNSTAPFKIELNSTWTNSTVNY